MWLPRLGLHQDLKKTRPQQRRGGEKQTPQRLDPPSVSEKFRRILQKHDTPVQFKPSNTLRQSVRRNARNCTLGKPSNLSTEEWHNTDAPPLQARTQQSTYT